MKIWYISKYANIPTKEGATRHFMLSKAMTQQGQEITMIYSRANGYIHDKIKGLHKSSFIDGVNCVMINGPIISLGLNIKRLFSWIGFEIKLFIYSVLKKKKEKPDILLVSSLSILTFITGIILKKIFNCKLIIEVRDIWPDTLIQIGKISSNGIIAKTLRAIEKNGYKKADGIISTMPKFDLYLKEKYDMNKPFKCIPQGFDDSWLSSKIKDNNIFDSNSFNVCYAGTIGKANYVEHIVEAASLLEKENIKFYIIGDGPLKKTLMNKYNLSNVVFVDMIPKDRVINFISYANLLIHTCSKHPIYRYGASPYKWVDYMLAGVPILISYDGYRSILNEADCAFFVEAENIQQIAEKILEISKMDRDTLIRMGNRGKTYAIKYLNYNFLSNELLEFINNIAQISL